MKLTKPFILERATRNDAINMMELYRLVYGNSYPIIYGNDHEYLIQAIENSQTHLIVVVRDTDKNRIVGILIAELDHYFKIGKLVGLLVHPLYQKHKIGKYLVEYITEELLTNSDAYHSLYATTRTISIGPQIVFAKNKYSALGIFPNAHRLKRYETVTLFAYYKKDLLKNRNPPVKVLNSLQPLYEAVGKNLKNFKMPLFIDQNEIVTTSDEKIEVDFEIIRAPYYVNRRFKEHFPNKEASFFPFHQPNMLISDKSGKIEIFAYFSKKDGYCTLIKSTRPIHELNFNWTSLYMQLDDLGVSYIETLLPVSMHEAIGMLVNDHFVPSALYPAIREINGELIDYVILSRTMEPLNFEGMAILSAFRPFIDQYVEAWKKHNLDTIEVVYVTNI